MEMIIQNSESHNQRIRTVVQLADKSIVLNIKLRYSSIIDKWIMTVMDESEKPIIRNIPLIRGNVEETANLLHQFSYLGIGSAFACALVEKFTTENPSKDNFGIDKEFALVWTETR